MRSPFDDLVPVEAGGLSSFDEADGVERCPAGKYATHGKDLEKYLNGKATNGREVGSVAGELAFLLREYGSESLDEVNRGQRIYVRAILVPTERKLNFAVHRKAILQAKPEPGVMKGGPGVQHINL